MNNVDELTATAKVATVLGSIPASSDSVESEGRQMKQCWINYIKNPKNPPVSIIKNKKLLIKKKKYLAWNNYSVFSLW